MRLLLGSRDRTVASTGGWLAGAISGAVADGVTAAFATIKDFCFNGDGSQLVITDNSSNLGIYNTASPYSITGLVSAGTFNAYSTTKNRKVHFSDDGLFIYAGKGGESIYGYALATAFDLTSATGTVITSIQFVDNVIFYNGGFNALINDSDLSLLNVSLATAYDLSASTVISTVNHTTKNIAISSDGLILYSIDAAEIIHEYPMATPYDATTLGAETSNRDVSADILLANAKGITFNANGTKLFVSDSNGIINQFSV